MNGLFVKCWLKKFPGIVHVELDRILDGLPEGLMEEMQVKPKSNWHNVNGLGATGLDPFLDPVLNLILDPVPNPVLDAVLDPALDPVLDSVLNPILDSIMDSVLDLVMDPVSIMELEPEIDADVLKLYGSTPICSTECLGSLASCAEYAFDSPVSSPSRLASLILTCCVAETVCSEPGKVVVSNGSSKIIREGLSYTMGRPVSIPSLVSAEPVLREDAVGYASPAVEDAPVKIDRHPIPVKGLMRW